MVTSSPYTSSISASSRSASAPLVGAQAVEHLAAQLARGLGHPVEVRLHVDAELVGGRAAGGRATNASVRLASANSFLASWRNPP